jgi:hypothetical protein
MSITYSSGAALTSETENLADSPATTFGESSFTVSSGTGATLSGVVSGAVGVSVGLATGAPAP